ncbi:autotransporter outer membrane beta-barrel domain-containing protein [Bartonella taylorii]|uniref:autotransporter outer membrane beta-barrel domain-containing protein n=1 Tax=Bartonella taylorii TaxID=33046 RepID=UPI001ABBBC38|nr:autotransporter outer membrane beta-barrel domain-containing protein [Bartonella taylorii]
MVIAALSLNPRYAALQGVINFAALESAKYYNTFCLIEIYGQLSSTTKNMQDTSKSTLNKMATSLTAYSSIQHDSGFYLDTLLSYESFKKTGIS